MSNSLNPFTQRHSVPAPAYAGRPNACHDSAPGRSASRKVTIQQSLSGLRRARRRQLLKKAFSETEVEEVKPGKTRGALTKEVAEEPCASRQND